MHDDSLNRLAEAGVSVGQLSHAQREVLGGLTEAELGVLTGVLRRVGSVTGDVEGQAVIPVLL